MLEGGPSEKKVWEPVEAAEGNEVAVDFSAHMGAHSVENQLSTRLCPDYEMYTTHH